MFLHNLFQSQIQILNGTELKTLLDKVCQIPISKSGSVGEPILQVLTTDEQGQVYLR